LPPAFRVIAQTGFSKSNLKPKQDTNINITFYILAIELLSMTIQLPTVAHSSERISVKLWIG
jgi:hypothetical protein